ncbi:hypothetical protein BT67DRAFT_310269 [Trichocladium antarcticum]|uniref:Uncharacterized protein n=1 Tax=Trichocladium antarcticum TaxID=1450529 RepID=A0AAN6ZE56_9PEZI|nr:hypothetical protein BT67DRAFT_310269 [Trichocladium antarcticum]
MADGHKLRFQFVHAQRPGPLYRRAFVRSCHTRKPLGQRPLRSDRTASLVGLCFSGIASCDPSNGVPNQQAPGPSPSTVPWRVRGRHNWTRGPRAADNGAMGHMGAKQAAATQESAPGFCDRVRP